MKFILSLSLLWVCFGAPAIMDQLSRLDETKHQQHIEQLSLLSSFNSAWNDEGVMVRTIPFGVDQMGNRLSWYFEALICCNMVGLHFVRPGTITAHDDLERKFFGTFPLIVPHPHPSNANITDLRTMVKKICPNVMMYPHEYDGAWSKRIPEIGAMMRKAIQAAFPNVHRVTIRKDSMEYLVPSDHQESQLPLIPSAAILFRCVDILDHGMYGFVNFNTYKELIPANATYIYILTEMLTYASKNAVNRKHCVDIGHFLVDFLKAQFPKAVIALRRGHAMDSVAMLSHAEVVVSAPSTFVLFPGIAGHNKVYLMPGKLFKDQPFLRDQFFWITSPTTVYGENLVRPHEAGALQKYKTAFTAPLTEKVEVVTHTSKRVGN